MIYLAKKCIKSITGIDYPSFLYNSKEGKLKEIKLSYEQEQELIDSLRATKIFYWPEEYNEPILEDINVTKNRIR